MKKLILTSLVVVLALSCTSGTAQALPIGDSNEMLQFFAPASDLSRFSAGVTTRLREGDVTLDSGGTMNLEAERVAGYIAYDLLRWLTVYGTIGSTDTTLGATSTGDSETEWGGGVRVNLLNHDLEDPLLMENRILVYGTVEYTVTEAQFSRQDVDYGDLEASLYVSIVNDIEGSKLYAPNAIGLFAGALYSQLSGDLENEDDTGYSAGLAIYFSEKVAFEFAAEDVGDSGYSAALHVRF